MAEEELETRRWKRVEYDRLIECGFFQPGEAVELVGGQLIVAEPQGTRHFTSIRAVQEALRVAFGAGWEVRTQAPVALDDESEPEPDVAVVPGSFHDYVSGHPSRPVLIVEVSESSLAFDRAHKGSLYARAGLADYWIVNLVDRVLEVYRGPVRDPDAQFGWRYQSVVAHGPQASIAPLALPQTLVRVCDLLISENDSLGTAMKDPQEEAAIQRFISYLGKTQGAAFAVTDRDVPVATGENFDYRIEDGVSRRLAVEIFRLAEGEELATYATWGRVVEGLKRELETHGVTGYRISSPVRFSVTRAQLPAFARGLADQLIAAIREHPQDSEFRYERFILRKLDGVSGVLIGGIGEGKFVDPAGTAARALQEKLTKKSSQLSVQDHERVILIVNHVGFVDTDDVIETVTRLNPTEFPNVDLIVFEATPGVHRVVFDRGAAEAVSKDQLPASGLAHDLIVQQLKHRLHDKDVAAFDFVRSATERHGEIGWLDDSEAREELVGFGDELLKADRVDDAIWIVRTLRDDPDPALTSASHQRIRDGEDGSLITSVRGRLCWLIMRIICTNRPPLYPELTGIVREYLHGENLYVRVQACVPLQALMQRRRLEQLPDGTPFDWDQAERESVKALALGALRASAGIPRVVEALMPTFNAPRDLSEAEAEEMIRIGLGTNAEYVLDDVAFHLICYALFRDGTHEALGRFDPTRLVALLREQLISGAPAMRGTLVWHIGKIIEQQSLPYGALKEFVDLAFEPPYDPRIEHAEGQIISELAKRDPAEARRLVARQIVRMEEYSARPGHEPVWITWTDEVLPLYADHADELLALTAGLERLWFQGAFIGEERTIAQAFRIIRDPRRRAEAEGALHDMYRRMRAVRPKLPELPSD